MSSHWVNQGTGFRGPVLSSRVLQETARPTLFLVQIFAKYMVLRHLVRAISLLVSVVSAFDTSDEVGFKPDAVCSRLCFDRIRVDQMTYLRVGSDKAG